jgi:hypothetical protein
VCVCVFVYAAKDQYADIYVCMGACVKSRGGWWVEKTNVNDPGMQHTHTHTHAHPLQIVFWAKWRSTSTNGHNKKKKKAKDNQQNQKERARVSWTINYVIIAKQIFKRGEIAHAPQLCLCLSLSTHYTLPFPTPSFSSDFALRRAPFELCNEAAPYWAAQGIQQSSPHTLPSL